MEKEEVKFKMGKLLNKKAQTPGDVILLVVFLFALAIGAVVISYIMGIFTDEISQVEALNSTEANAAFQSVNDLNNRWDYLILFLFVGVAIALMVIGYFIDVDSIFMVLYIIALVIAVVLASALTYVWENFSSNSTFITTVSNSFPITNHIITNLALYMTIMGALSMVATYAKVRGQDGL